MRALALIGLAIAVAVAPSAHALATPRIWPPPGVDSHDLPVCARWALGTDQPSVSGASAGDDRSAAVAAQNPPTSVPHGAAPLIGRSCRSY